VVPPVANLMLAIIGCGNPNRADDGAGVAVVRLLQRQLGARGDVRVLDAGTDGMAVMFGARGADSLVVVDACQSGSPPGAIFEVPGEAVAQPHAPSLNLHDFRWDHALYAGRKMLGDAFPTDVTAFLIEARSVGFGLALSPEVEAAVVEVASRIAGRVLHE